MNCIEMSKFNDERNKKCSCGKTITFNRTKVEVCTHCGHLVYYDKLTLFREKAKMALRKGNKNEK